MPADHSTPQPSNNLSKQDFAVPDEIIEDFLGLGLAYSEWPAEVKKRGHVWYPGLENIIIEKEWEFFKPEIQRLRLEPKIAQSSRSKSNSLASILKRLKGEPWLEGRPDEREERLRTHRLLGKDAKIRCLQKYVRDWDQEASFSASPLSDQNAIAKPAAKSAPSQQAVPDNPAFELGTLRDSPEMRYSSDTPEPEARLTPGNVNINPDTLQSICHCPSQLASSMAPLSTQSDPFLVANRAFEAFQNAVPVPDIETSGHNLESELSETYLKSPPAFSHDRTMASFDHYPIGEDDVPTSDDYSQDIDLPEREPNVLKWMATNQVSENFEPAEAEAPRPGPAFQGTFFNSHNSFMSNYFVFEETEALEAGSTTESMSVDLARQHNSHQGCPEIVSQLISSPRCSSKSRKRRRQNTSSASLDIPGYGNAITPSTSHVACDGDTMMSGYGSGSQHTTELLPMPPCSGMISKPAYTHIRKQIELELELQRTREEFNSVRKQHQKDLESFIRKQQAAEAEISELSEQVREMKESTEYYEELVRGYISENIILQEANSKMRSVSGLPPTSTREREHGIKPVQIFPPSKNPRPLSLTLRPANASKASSPPRKLSASTLQDTSTRRLPIATSSSNRPDSPDNTQVSSEDPALAHIAHKSTGRRYRPDSADSSQVSSGQPIPVSSPSKHTGRNNSSGSTDSIAAPNLSTSTRRDHNSLQQLMHKFSSPFLRKQYRDDTSRAVQTAPILPPLEASVPLNRQMAGVLVNSDKRLTNDSGYDSLRFDSSRASITGPE